MEYDRHNFNGSLYSHGRIYWAKFFSAPNGLNYDVELFHKWYNQITRWLKKQGKRQTGDAYQVYYLPDAWNRYISRNEVYHNT